MLVFQLQRARGQTQQSLRQGKEELCWKTRHRSHKRATACKRLIQLTKQAGGNHAFDPNRVTTWQGTLVYTAWGSDLQLCCSCRAGMIHRPMCDGIKKQHTKKTNCSALPPPSHTELIQSRQLPSSLTPFLCSFLPRDVGSSGGWCLPPANSIHGRPDPAAAKPCTHTHCKGRRQHPPAEPAWIPAGGIKELSVLSHWAQPHADKRACLCWIPARPGQGSLHKYRAFVGFYEWGWAGICVTEVTQCSCLPRGGWRWDKQPNWLLEATSPITQYFPLGSGLHVS